MYDKEKMIQSVKLGLEACGVEDDEHSCETPERVAKMGEILYTTQGKDPKEYVKLFPKGSDSPVMQKEIPFYSFCAHHHLPFYGKVAIVYVPNETNIGLSKLARVVRHFAKGFTTQELLTRNIADFLMNCDLNPKEVMVVVDSTHTCMTIRGVRAPGVQTRTTEHRWEASISEGMAKALENKFWSYVGTPTSFGY